MKARILTGASFRIMAAWVGIIGLVFPGRALAGEEEPRMIRILVANYSSAAPAAVTAAEREAGRILGQAGLRAFWLDCAVQPSVVGAQDPCKTQPQAADIRVRILARRKWMQSQDSAIGFALHPAMVSVYYENVLQRAQSYDAGLETPIILGCIIAHELGHLLLGSNSHSDKGIMLPRWEVNQVRQLRMGRLLFTPGESQRMRLEAQARSERQNLASTSSAP